MNASGARLALFHSRLSIIDLSQAAHQPLSTGDGSHFIVFNGEIYNYLELRRELQALGHRFLTSSDTEVLLQGYVAWGRGVLDRLIGMYAFAILDLPQQKLFLSRDPIGIKPLYLSRSGGHFTFASEIKGVLALTRQRRAANAAAVYHYLAHGLTDAHDGTMFSDLRRLPPGAAVEVDLAPPYQVREFGAPPAPPHEPRSMTLPDAAANLRSLLLDSIGLHLRSDVPVGIALSGGIDSSAIAAVTRHLSPGATLHAFTYSATGSSLDEFPWADRMAREVGAQLHTVRATSPELIRDMDHLIRMQEEPFVSTSIYAQYRVFQSARETGIKVLLDGQGADELFGGYNYFRAARLASLLAEGDLFKGLRFFTSAAHFDRPQDLLLWLGEFVVPERLQGPLRSAAGEELVPPGLRLEWLKERGVKPRSVRSMARRHILQSELSQTFSKLILPKLLRYEDRNSMAHSIESRVPFLTPQILRFSRTLPEEFLVSPRGDLKILLREALRGIVPECILARRDKIGFQTPELPWFQEMKPWFRDTFQGEAARSNPALNTEPLLRTLDLMDTLSARSLRRLWRFANLIKWTEVFGVTFD